ncbi:MAG: 4Fe-4S dicluster domain-containing protein [Actinobacteria bacterium]|nr:4Fe-4S dicluster domain-containing protein [Actinomycetota bacterium]
MKGHGSRLGALRASLWCLAGLEAVQRSLPCHWGDAFIEEHSPLRLFMLKHYARIEVRLLSVLFWILNLQYRFPVFGRTWVKRLSYYAAGKFVGEHMVAGQVMTLEEMLEFIDGLPDENLIAVGPCRCRLATRACDHPMETDIYILTGAPIWLEVFPKDYRPIDKEETKRIVRESYGIGLVPMVDRHMYYRGNANYFVICNCCGCACVPIRGYRYYKEVGFRFIPSTYRSVVDLERCEGCGTCVEVCAFEERRLIDGRAQVLSCQGCGQCVRACPNRANRMVGR